MGTTVGRGNGLRADDYVRVARPTTAVAELALDALRRTGIAASVTETGGARCELRVDSHELDDARTVLAAVVRHAGVPDTDLGAVGEEDVLFELAELGLDDALVERGPDADARDDGSDDAPDDTAGHLGTDDRDDPAGTRNPTPSARPYPTPSRPRAARRRAADHDDLDDDLDPDDHFRPGEPESLRSLSRTTVWALAVLAVGVLALAVSGLAPTVVGAYAPLASLLGTAAVLVGVGMLVTRLRDGRRDDGDDDRGGPNGDGAVL